MKQCEKCNITISTSKKQCPLCYNELGGSCDNGQSILYPQTPQCDNLARKNYFLVKLFAFLSFSIIAICGFINLYTSPGHWWVLIPSASIGYVWVLITHTIMSRRNLMEKALFQLVSITALGLATNYISGGGNWFWPYVLPSAAIAITVVFILFCLVNKSRNEHLLSIVAMSVILTAISIVLITTNTDTYKILNSINILLNGLFVFAIIVFGFKSLKNSASKNLHV